MGEFRGVELDGLIMHGPRLTLRPWRDSDANRVAQIMQDPSMREFLALPNPYTLSAARRFVTELGDEGRAEGTGIGCALIETATGFLVGSAALRLTGQQDVGYWIASDFRGHGYAAEATGVLTDWAFAHGLRAVRLMCDVRNVASAHTALAAGFRYEGSLRDFLSQPLDAASSPRVSDLAVFGRSASDPAGPTPPSFTALPRQGLSDGVLCLRATVPHDVAALAETDDPLTLEWGFTGEPHTPEQMRRLTDRAQLDWLVGRAAPFSIVDLASGQVAGSLHLRLAGPPGVGGIGYVVHPAFRGRGYTARALRLLAAWAFGHGGFVRLELGAKVGNVASQRAALAAGFEPDGTRAARLRNPDGTYADEARFCLINPSVRRG